MAELAPLFPGGGRRRRSKARLSFPKRADRRTNDGMHEILAKVRLKLPMLIVTGEGLCSVLTHLGCP
jgi:hypothetical protein